MKRVLVAIGSALAYFTIIPVGRFVRNVAPDPLAISFLPFVGALVGALAGLAGWMLAAHDRTWWPIVTWLVLIALTGAIHVDGFLDCCDGLFASATPARRLEILHDPRHGTFALVGMAALAAVWLTAIARIAPSHVIVTLAFSATLARIAAIVNAWVFPYARAGAITPAFVSRPNVAVVALSALLAFALGWWIDPVVFALVPASIALSLLAAWWASNRLGGGLTGDVFGGVIVVVEVATLIVVGAIAP